MKAVVTGGAGFIGGHLVRRLVRDGARVTVIDDLSTGREGNLAGVDGAELVVRDLVGDPIDDVLAGADIVFHLAAVPSVPRSVRDPWRSHEAAASATLRTLIAARDAGVRRFVASSSSSVYGDISAPPMRETMPTAPRSPYAVAKLAAEGYTRVFASLFGMETVSLRYFNVFGPRQDPTSAYAAAIPRFISAYQRREAPTVYGDGTQSRDFTYVDNVVEANVLASTAPELRGESLNVGAGRPHTVLELLQAIADVFGYEQPPRFEPERPGDIRHSHADTSAAERLIGFRPVVGFEQGIRRTIEAFSAPAATGA
jgi:UDP-glucose 4-epimerase